MHLEINQATDRTERVANSVVTKLYNLAFTNGIQESQLDSLSTVVGSISVAATYDAYITYLTTRFPNLYITADSTYIKFVNNEFERILIAKGVGDGTGITQNDAAQVSSVTGWFNSSTSVDFTDLQYLTKYGLTITNLYSFSAGTLNSLNILQGTYASPTVFNTVEINFPRNGSVYFQESVLYTADKRRKIGISGVDWNGCQILTNTGRQWYQNNIFTSCYFYCDSSQVIPPTTTDLSHIRIFNNCTINSVVFPEGFTQLSENFQGCQTNYIEFPATVTNLSVLFQNFRRDADGVNAGTGCIVIKAVSPPIVSSPNSSHKYPAHIYVPDNSVSAYMSGSGAWSDSGIQALITPMSQMTAGERELGTVTQADIDRT